MTVSQNIAPSLQADDLARLATRIRQWATELGFQQLGISDTDLAQAEQKLQAWLARDFHGTMAWMARHGSKRSRPAELEPGTLRVLSVRMDYLPQGAEEAEKVMADDRLGFVSRYALGRDYHKLMRKRLQQLASRIEAEIGTFGYRVFVDSAPVLEKPLASKAGLGWMGKHSNVINRHAGSWFFLGEIYTSLPLPVDRPASNHCGDCTACIDVCPTRAIVEPYTVDARLCISYLTIEQSGPIPVELRPLMGNRIYGCDDCQLVCPWNRFARSSQEADFLPRHRLDAPALVDLFGWDEATFLKKLEGSPIRRIGYPSWLRNIAVALGNAGTRPEVVDALLKQRQHSSGLVREHVSWALAQHGEKK